MEHGPRVDAYPDGRHVVLLSLYVYTGAGS